MNANKQDEAIRLARGRAFEWLRVESLREGATPHAAIALEAWHAAMQPVDLVLHCPACGLQHVDAPWKVGDPLTNDQITGVEPVWDNPPHRTHLCHRCGHKWRPADVATNGVEAVKTRGTADSPIEKDRLRAWPFGREAR